jgi:hypothetical protein
VSSYPIILHRPTQTLDHSLEGARSPGLVTGFGVKSRVIDVSNPLWGNLPLSGGLIRWQSDQDDYAYFSGRVVMSGDDGVDPSTRVPIC